MSDTTRELQALLDSWHDGDSSAHERLIERSLEQVRRLARRMLRNDRVRHYEQTDDVVQESMLRLHQALDATRPRTADEFMRLSATQIRRVTIDMARRLFGPQGMARNLAGQPFSERQDHAGRAEASPSNLAAAGDSWLRFYETAEQLPDAQREVFELIWIQRLTQVEAARILDVSERTVRSRWNHVRIALGAIVRDLQSGN